MIDVKTAVSAAYEYLKSLQGIMATSAENWKLEEVEISDDRKFWLITLGFERPLKVPQKPLDAILGSPLLSSPNVKYQLDYKLFKVNSETGEVEAMKIREV